MIYKVGFLLCLMLSLKSYGAESDLNLGSAPRRTIASITEEMREKLNVLLEKQRAAKEVAKKFPPLKDEMMQLQESLVGRFEFLRIQTVSHYQEATGLLRNRKTGSLLVDERFHLKLVEFYKKGLEILKKKKMEAPILLVEQRIAYYGSLCNIYAEDKSKFLVHHKEEGSREIRLRNSNLLFLTTLVEEKEEVFEAINFLQQFPSLFNPDAKKYPVCAHVYESYTLGKPHLPLEGALDMEELSKVCDEQPPPLFKNI